MSIKSAFVNNKLDYQVFVGDEMVERVYVHPNMIQLPRRGDKLVLAQVNTVVYDARLDSDDESNQQHTTLNLEVLDVLIVHSVVRTRKDGAVTTELMQQVQVMCRDLRDEEFA